jgi:hypothetical protein
MKGIKAIGIAPYDALNLPVNTATGVIDIPDHMVGKIARIEVKASGNNIVETGTFDEATRTMEYVGVNTFFVPDTNENLRAEIQTLAGFLCTIYVEDYNGKVRILGSQNGCDIMTVVGGTDVQGFTLTINSKEKEMAYTVTGAGIAEYKGAFLPYI